MANRTYTVYALIDPRDNSVRYVGITERPINKRLAGHLLGNDGNKTKIAWISELDRLGISPIIRPLEQIKGRKETLEREQYWIQHFLSLGAPLTNIMGNPSASKSRGLFGKVQTKATEEWIPINTAAKRLGVSSSRISDLAFRGKIRTKHDLVDLRVKLVEYNEVYNLFASSSMYQDRDY